MADIWETFTREERHILGQMWFHRRVDGLDRSRLLQILDMDPESAKSQNLLRTHLAHIRGKLQGREVPFERDAGMVYWRSLSGRLRAANAIRAIS